VGYDPDVAIALEQDRLGAKIAAGEGSGFLRGCTGTPDQIREYLLRFEEAGVDQIIFVLQAGKNRHEDICEAIELFGREVLPEFKDRDEAQVKAKADRLAPVLEAAMARRPADPPLAEGYHFPAMPRKWVDDSGSEEAKQWLEKFAADRAAGNRDADLGILG
jgi:hypothetical protein